MLPVAAPAVRNAVAMLWLLGVLLFLAVYLAAPRCLEGPLSGGLACRQPAVHHTPAAMTVVIMHSGDFWWTGTYGPHFRVPDCTWGLQPLSCQYVSAAHTAGNATATLLAQQAAAFVSHMCWSNSSVPVKYRSLPQVLFTMESDANHPCINQQHADVEMSYRTCSQVWAPYLPNYFPEPLERLELWSAPMAFHDKRSAVMYVNSNCAANNGRQAVMMQLQALLQASNSSVSVHGYGRCNPNMDAATLAAFQQLPQHQKKEQKKREYSRKYKFCVAMENSIAKDYVSEKVYDALVAGCVPIYWGAPNINDYIPTADAIIDYARLGSPDALKAELERLSSNQTAYEQKHAWRQWSKDKWSPGFQRLIGYKQHPLCDLCALAASWNQTGYTRPSYTLCSSNATWKG